MTNDIKAKIARVRELDQAATPGPFRVKLERSTPDWFMSGLTNTQRDALPDRKADLICPDGGLLFQGGRCSQDNAALFAEFRTLAPELADECERLRDRVVLLKGEMSIENPSKYKTALEEAFDDCSKLIDGNDRWEYAGQMVRAVQSVVEERDKALEELETSQSYRTGISNDLRQVEEQSSGLSHELSRVVGLLGETPARSVLFGPGETDGVAYIVGRRLKRDAARVEERDAALEKVKALEAALAHTHTNLQIVGKDGDATELLLIAAQERGDKARAEFKALKANQVDAIADAYRKGREVQEDDREGEW